MKGYKVESDFNYKGFRCVVVGQRMGHRCGYVAIPAGHELYGEDYDSIGLEVHGGLTYAEYSDDYNYPVESKEKVYWLGFDCGHWNDGKDLDLIRELCDECTSSHIINMEVMFPTGGEVRTTDYVKHELVELVDQIVNKSYSLSDWEE